MVGRPDYDAELIGMLESTVGCPAITTAGAEVAALSQAANKKLALLTPYPEQMTLMEKEYLEMTVPWLESSFPPVVGSVFRIGHRRHRANDGLRESRNIDTDQTDALFLSGTNWRTVDVARLIESDLGMPVFSATLVSMWAALGRLGISGKTDYGSLLDQT